MQLRVHGTPIAGEDRREHAWRARIASEAKRLGIANVGGVALAFTLASGRRVDVGTSRVRCWRACATPDGSRAASRA